ncbi:MAG: ABC transporter permease subunit [Acidobacteriota bacterium]
MLGLTMAVAWKELREILRDRRSLASALLYAVWGPAVMALALVALARDRGAETAFTLAVDGASQAPALVAYLAEQSVAVEPADDVARRVRARELPAALIVGEDYPGALEASRPAPLTLVYDGAWTASTRRAARVRSLMAEYGRRIGDTRLVLRGVAPSVASPIRLSEQDVSTAAARAATVLATLPIFVLLASFIGGMSAAADVTAGERERGSLASLLLHPVPRGVVAVGKWAAVAALALVTLTLTLAVSRWIVDLHAIQAIDLPVGLSTRDAALMWLVLAPLALLAPAAQTLAGWFSKSYKEAQTQLSVLLFVPMLPGFLFAFGTVTPDAWMRWTPVLGQHLLVGEILRGLPLAWTDFAALTSATLVAAAAALEGSRRVLGREGITRRLDG